MNDRQMLDKWREFYAATLFDLPAAAAQTFLPNTDHQSEDKVFDKVAWRAYDAWIWLVNETANRFYTTSFKPSPTPSRQLRLAFPVPRPLGISTQVVGRSHHPGDFIEAR